MSDLLMQDPLSALRREHDSSDDFEHLEHELQMHHNNQQPSDSPFHRNNGQQQPLLDFGDSFANNVPSAAVNKQQQQTLDLLDDDAINASGLCKPVPATPPPSADLEAAGLVAAPFDHLEQLIGHELDADPMGAKASSLAFVQSERRAFEVRSDDRAAKPALTGFEDDDEDDDSQLLQLKGRPSERLEQDDEDDDDTEPERSQSLGTPARKLAPADSPRSKLPLDADEFDDDSLILVDKPAPPPGSLHEFDEAQHVVHSSRLPEPQKSPELDFVREEMLVQEATREKPAPWTSPESIEDAMAAPTKPLPPPPADDDLSGDFLAAESGNRQHRLSGGASDTGDSEFESEPEPSPARSIGAKAQPPAPAKQTLVGDVHERKTFVPPKSTSTRQKSRDEDEIAPKAIFRDIGIDAWFNPERLNPKVEALIYWRDPKKSGIVFGATLTVLLSLAYFSLISVVAYISLLTLTFTVGFRIYKTVLQAIQKTSDGHPFKDILDVDLALPAEKVHEVADIAVANANAAVSELRRLFLVDDIVDSLKFGILLWSLTYLGSWFNGMTLIILGVIALFTLPKVYETNKTQIDQNLALVQAKINELTAKVKAAMPIGKKAEPAKEE